jgi:F-type H+-transporting ATPase subunit a
MTSSIFAAGDTPGIHVSLKAEELWNIGGISITNSMIYGPLVAIVLALLLINVAKRSRVEPVKGKFYLVAIVESVVKFVVGILEGAFGSRKQAFKYAPIFATFFIFILFSNMSGFCLLLDLQLKFRLAKGKYHYLDRLQQI